MALINGTTQNDDLTGTSGDDIIDGGFGADVMKGLGGNDTYYVDNAFDVVKEAAGGGTDTVISSISYFMADNVENLILTDGAYFGVGNQLNNVMTGGDGANYLDGGAGNDTLNGGKGDVIYIVDSTGDKIVETLNQAAGGGIDYVQSSVSFSLAGLANVEKLQLMGSDKINATGNAGANELVGNGADNKLDGGKGADDLWGNGGNDTYYIDNAGDKVHEAAKGGGEDWIVSAIAFTNVVTGVENYSFNTKTSVHFTGDAGGNSIEGGSANDVIVGGGGAMDILYGNAGDDDLTGGTGNDYFDGGAGADKMTGGAGNDVYLVDNIGDNVVEDNAMGSGHDTIVSYVSIDQLALNVEDLYLAGKGAHGTGNDLDNLILANEGANVLDGGKGADAMGGGLGNDTYTVDNAGDTVAENGGAGSGIDLVKSSVDLTLGANLENLTLTGAAQSGTGNALNNIITGNDGENWLDGLGGNDTLIGGKGGDVYFVDSLGDKVVETLTMAKGGGEDWVESTIDYSLAGHANVDDLILLGTAIKGTGNALENAIFGNASDNILDGGKGADAMQGDLGNDTYYVDNLSDVVVEKGGADHHDTVISTVAFTSGMTLVEDYTFNTTAAVHFTGDAGDNIIKGGSGADIIVGGGGHDQLFGGAGNDDLSGGSLHDLLDGGTGADILHGGDGDDSYFVDNAGDQIKEGTGTDTVFSSISVDVMWQDIENLELLGTGALHVTGNALDNHLTGNNGNNLIDGGNGADTLYGQKGNDTLTGGTGSDTFQFNPSAAGNEGHDTVTDFVKAEDVLSFSVGDVNNSGTIDIADLWASTSVVDHGAGQAVDVTFADGGMITFAGAGTGSVATVDELVGNAATQLQIH